MIKKIFAGIMMLGLLISFTPAYAMSTKDLLKSIGNLQKELSTLKASQGASALDSISRTSYSSSAAPTISTDVVGTTNSTSVMKMQNNLNVLGYNLSADGNFGPATLSAVATFQKVNNLPITGYLDTATSQALNNAVNLKLTNPLSLSQTLSPSEGGSDKPKYYCNDPVTGNNGTFLSLESCKASLCPAHGGTCSTTPPTTTTIPPLARSIAPTTPTTPTTSRTGIFDSIKSGLIVEDSEIGTNNYSVNVLYPKGGESFDFGQKIQVVWKSAGLSNADFNTDVYLKMIDGNQKYYLNHGFIQNDGSETFSLPTDITPGNYFLYIGVLSKDGKLASTGKSIGSFNIGKVKNSLVYTDSATDITNTTAYLYGHTDMLSVPIGGKTVPYFQYSTDPKFITVSNDNPLVSQSINDSSKYSAYIKNLSPDVTYYFRFGVKIMLANGILYKDINGEILSFYTHATEPVNDSLITYVWNSGFDNLTSTAATIYAKGSIKYISSSNTPYINISSKGYFTYESSNSGQINNGFNKKTPITTLQNSGGVPTSGLDGKWSYRLTGLTPDTTYCFRATEVRTNLKTNISTTNHAEPQTCFTTLPSVKNTNSDYQPVDRSKSQ